MKPPLKFIYLPFAQNDSSQMLLILHTTADRTSAIAPIRDIVKQQVIALGKLGWSLRKIERATGVRRETAGAYLRTAGIAIRIPRAWGRRAPAKPANEVTPDFVGRCSQSFSSPAGRVSACKPYRELIEEQLSRGRNAKAIWQDLEPGEEAQVDYGSGPLVRDSQTGKYRRTRLFVLTLGYSRKSQTSGRDRAFRRLDPRSPALGG